MTEHIQDSGGKNQAPRRRLKLTRRSDFLDAAKGKRFHSRSFSLQAVRRRRELPGEDQAAAAPRFGFTVTKRIGGAVVRNRIRRRLKEALRLVPDLPERPGYDYVIVARPAALGQSFSALQDELTQAVAGIHAPGGISRSKGRLGAKQAPAALQDIHAGGNDP
ncbi:MAG: ribonuclease P protein component [Beijerinckiaceae bacterium]